jgi:hypothetical protein
MSFIGGDVLEIVAQNPTAGSFRFSPKAAESYTGSTGGFRNNDDTNGVTGNGQAIWQVNRTRWSFEGPVSVDFLSGNGIQDLTVLASAQQDTTFTITLVSGQILKGTGRFVGELPFDTNTAQSTIKIQGGGQLISLI